MLFWGYCETAKQNVEYLPLIIDIGSNLGLTRAMGHTFWTVPKIVDTVIQSTLIILRDMANTDVNNFYNFLFFSLLFFSFSFFIVLIGPPRWPQATTTLTRGRRPLSAINQAQQ